MSEMVERVARALEKESNERGSFSTHASAARAAIAAMREPSRAMFEQGGDFFDEDGWRLSTEVYQAMIDAALKD